MVSKSLTVALTLGILLGFTASACSQSNGSPGPYLAPPDNAEWTRAHPWQEALGESELSPYCPGLADDVRGVIPVPAFAKFALYLQFKYAIGQELGTEYGTSKHRRRVQLLSQGKRDGDSMDHNLTE